MLFLHLDHPVFCFFDIFELSLPPSQISKMGKIIRIIKLAIRMIW